LTVLIAANVAAFLACLFAYFALMRHLREFHLQLWMRFGNRRNPAVDPNESEKIEIESLFALWGYLRSGAWRKHGDARLERLIRSQRICFYVWCLTMAAAFISLLLPTR